MGQSYYEKNTSYKFNPYANPAISPYQSILKNVAAKEVVPFTMGVATRSEFLMLTSVIDQDILQIRQSQAQIIQNQNYIEPVRYLCVRILGFCRG